MRKLSLASYTLTMLILLTFVPTFMVAHARATAAGSGVGTIPQGTQSNAVYATSDTCAGYLGHLFRKLAYCTR